VDRGRDKLRATPCRWGIDDQPPASRVGPQPIQRRVSGPTACLEELGRLPNAECRGSGSGNTPNGSKKCINEVSIVYQGFSQCITIIAPIMLRVVSAGARRHLGPLDGTRASPPSSV